MHGRFLPGRQRRDRAAVRKVAIGGLALAGGGLAPAGPALAAKHAAHTKHATHAKQAAKVVSRYWQITVGGHAYTVKAGGEIDYPACEPVESIAPVVKVKVKGNFEEIYRATIVGPKEAGTSDGWERPFKGPSAVIDPPFVAQQFALLAKNTNVPHLGPGSYTLELSFGKSTTALEKAGKPTMVEKIKLVTRAGC
jgi:hypothetical protein